jgi:transcriptional regulator with XRE-family HTH domain
VVTVQRWSGREARLLRDALRMSLRDFAAYVGVSGRTVSNWEDGGASYHPRDESQAVLDTALGRASDDVKARFAAALGTNGAAPRHPSGDPVPHRDLRQVRPVDLLLPGPVPQLDTVDLDQSHGPVFLDAEAQLEKYRVLLSRMEATALDHDSSRDFIHTIVRNL